MYGDEEGWRQFAEEVGGEYKCTEERDSRTRIVKAPWRKWTVMLVEGWGKVQGMSSSDYFTHAEVEVPFEARDRLRFVAHRHSLPSAVVGGLVVGLGAAIVVGLPLSIGTGIAVGVEKGNETVRWMVLWIVGAGLLGFAASLLFSTVLDRPEVNLADSELPGDFHVHGNDKDKVRAFFANSKVCRFFEDHPEGELHVREPRLVGDHPSRARVPGVQLAAVGQRPCACSR